MNTTSSEYLRWLMCVYHDITKVCSLVRATEKSLLDMRNDASFQIIVDQANCVGSRLYFRQLLIGLCLTLNLISIKANLAKVLTRHEVRTRKSPAHCCDCVIMSTTGSHAVDEPGNKSRRYI